MDLIPFGFDPFSKIVPRIDVQETIKEVILTADVPGIDPKNINVEVSQDSIKISATVHEEKESKGKNFYRKERISHSFHRVVPLPCPVKEDGVKAMVKNGILTVTLPKKHPVELKMKKIPIEEV